MRTKYAHRIRGLTGLAFLILFGITAGLIVGEFAVRLLGVGKPEFYSYSPSRGWKLRAGASGWQRDEGCAFIRINRWGYRGDNWAVAKPRGTLRIAVLGDSFVEAPQVDENKTASARIEQTLALMTAQPERRDDRAVKRIQVMNFGVDGYGTAQELFTLTEDVWRFSPDIVVLVFFPGNDLRNNSAVMEGDKCRPFFVPHQGGLRLGGPFEDEELFRFHCFLRFESYHSRLLNVMGEARSTVRAVIHGGGLHVRQQPVSRARAAQSPSREPGINDMIYRPPIDQNWRDAWYVSEAEIAMVEQNLRAHGALFLTVIVGTGIQVLPNSDAQARYLRTVGGTDLFYPNQRIAAFAARAGFAVLDLAPPMKSYAQANGVFFHGFPDSLGTGHWNQVGNCFAGVMIANRLAAIIAERLSHSSSDQPDNARSVIGRGTSPRDTKIRFQDPAGTCLG